MSDTDAGERSPAGMGTNPDVGAPTCQLRRGNRVPEEATLSPVLASLLAPIVAAEMASASAAAYATAFAAALLTPAAPFAPAIATTAAGAAAAAVAASVPEQIKAANGLIIAEIMKGIAGQPVGLCGGMTFSVLDYYLRDWIVPRGNNSNDQPTAASATGAALRSYIWERQITSVKDNNALIAWVGVLHVGVAIPAMDGAKILREWSAGQLSVLTQRIDETGVPVPIGLIGTSWNPSTNHQVLCYGYEVKDGWTWLYVYDNNHPDEECTIQLRFDHGSDWVRESHAHQGRGPLRGLLCTKYYSASPPPSIVLRTGLSHTPVSPVEVGEQVSVQATVANVGYHVSPRFWLRAAKEDTFGTATVWRDSNQWRLAEGAVRTMNELVIYNAPGNQQLALRAFLGNFAGVDITKSLPPETAGQLASGIIAVFPHPTIVGAGPPRPECEPGGIVGSTFTVRATTDGMGEGLTFLWTVGGGATLDHTDRSTVSVQLPDTAGVVVTLTVTITRPDGRSSSATSTLTTISQADAELAQAICRAERKIARMREAHRQYGPLNPGPMHVGRDDIEQLLRLAQEVTKTTGARGAHELRIDPGNVIATGTPAYLHGGAFTGGNNSYTALGSPGAAVGSGILLAGESIEQHITLGQTARDRESQAEQLSELLRLLEHDISVPAEARAGAGKYLGKVRDELLEELEPDLIRVEKWLRNARESLGRFGKVGEVYEKAKEAFESFGLSL